jgi:hypothetical protein
MDVLLWPDPQHRGPGLAVEYELAVPRPRRTKRSTERLAGRGVVIQAGDPDRRSERLKVDRKPGIAHNQRPRPAGLTPQSQHHAVSREATITGERREGSHLPTAGPHTPLDARFGREGRDRHLDHRKPPQLLRSLKVPGRRVANRPPRLIGVLAKRHRGRRRRARSSPVPAMAEPPHGHADDRSHHRRADSAPTTETARPSHLTQELSADSRGCRSWGG